VSVAGRVDEWTGEDVSVAGIERELARLRTDAESGGVPDLRTSVMTHVAWVPPAWERAATDALAGLDERHPSRTLLLFPQPEAERDGIDANVSLRCFALGGAAARHVCTEVIELRLRGRRAGAPASIVQPLALPGLPLFLRWRGEPAWGQEPWEQLVDAVDRLVLDSGEWDDDVPAAYGRLPDLFGRTAVSDVAWARTLLARRALALRWPAIAGIEELAVEGPAAEAHLLAGWLRSRLRRPVALAHERAASLGRVAVDGEELDVEADTRDASDLLSEELDRFGRDPVYEAAVSSASSSTSSRLATTT
jgi:glucose-6-phosphate dehydrogenase assembly protein OpcA